MDDFIETVKERSRTLDLSIYESLSDNGAITVSDIASHWGKPLNLIEQRLEIMEGLGIAEVEGDIVSMSDSRVRPELPLNAKDLELTAREKLIIRALNNLHLANVDTMLEFLTNIGDQVKTRETIYYPLKRLVYLGLVQEISKENPWYFEPIFILSL